LIAASIAAHVYKRKEMRCRRPGDFLICAHKDASNFYTAETIFDRTIAYT